MIPKAEWYWASNIYTNVYKFERKKTEEKFTSSSLGKNFLFGWSFLENSWIDWQLAVSSQLAVSNGSKMTKTREKGKAKKEAEKFKEIGSTFGHARTKKCRKTGCYCKERHAFMFNFEQFGLITDRKMSINAIFSRISTRQWVEQLGQLKSVHISVIMVQFLLQGYW